MEKIIPEKSRFKIPEKGRSCWNCDNYIFKIKIAGVVRYSFCAVYRCWLPDDVDLSIVNCRESINSWTPKKIE
jgi:hypothetical protein